MAESKKDTVKNKNIHKGHREKVKGRFSATGLTGMADHNVLELLLFFGIPQRDTNPIAHELIEKFGSFSGVLEANKADLMSVKGMTDNAACLITMLLPLYKHYQKDLHKKRKKFSDAKAMADYLRPLYLDTTNERIYLLCFDSNDRLVACRQISEGDMSSSMLDIRKIASIILEVKANKAVLSHNHPNGSLDVSDDDIKVTKLVMKMLDMLKVNLVDHIIITDTSYVSMRNSPYYTHIFYGAEPLMTLP